MGAVVRFPTFDDASLRLVLTVERHGTGWRVVKQRGALVQSGHGFLTREDAEDFVVSSMRFFGFGVPLPDENASEVTK
ncbi:hypothetical protein EJV44_11305 [Ancylobacter aquaticus]|nr:hypothetical protein EJV44_11305 [Ancylobacter aquaticus]